MDQNPVGFSNLMYSHVGRYTPCYCSSYGGRASAPTMWAPISNPLANPTAPPKPVLGITQDEIVTDHEESFGEDDDFFIRKHNPRMPRIVLTTKTIPWKKK